MRRYVFVASTFFVTLCIGFFGVLQLRRTMSGAVTVSSQTTEQGATVEALPESETRLWFVYVGSPTCPWSTLPETATAVKKLENRLRRYANNQGIGFTALGVANTTDFRAGLAHLGDLGNFDDISIGDHRSNAITLDYLWNEGLVPSTPQIVLFERVVHRSDRGSLPGDFAGTSIQRLRHAAGLSALSDWASSSEILTPSTILQPKYSRSSTKGDFQ